MFTNYDLGITFLSPAGEYFSDAMVYNQQYRYIDIALNKALKDVVLDSDEYWDCVKNKRVDHETQNTISIKIYQLPEKYPLHELAKKESGYFFYSPCLGKDIRDELVKNIKEVEEKVFEYRVVQIIRISW